MRWNNYLLLLLCILFTQFSFAQIIEDKIIHGKIITTGIQIEGINVVNLVNEKSTVTNSNGEFFILAKANDLLVITSVNLEITRKFIEESDLKSDVILIEMIPLVTELEEVIINKHPEINAVSLGFISKYQKKYSPAERKLYEASGGITGLLNTFSGRKEILEKELEVEKKEIGLLKIESLFENEYYIKTLKVPEDYIKGFQYYCVEDANFRAALKSKNKYMAMFLIVSLAQNYNQISNNEK